MLTWMVSRRVQNVPIFVGAILMCIHIRNIYIYTTYMNKIFTYMCCFIHRHTHINYISMLTLCLRCFICVCVMYFIILYYMYLPSNHQNRPGCTYCTYAIHRFAFWVPYIEQLDIIYSLSAMFHYMSPDPLHLSRSSSVLLGLKRARNGVPCNEKKPSLQRGKFLSYSQKGS